MQYLFVFGSVNAHPRIEWCTKGAASETDPEAFEWIGPDGNVLGVAKADGTPNFYNSYVKEC